jgi:hypothetical protein
LIDDDNTNFLNRSKSTRFPDDGSHDPFYNALLRVICFPDNIMTSESLPASSFDPCSSSLKENKGTIDLLSTMIEGLAMHLYPSKNAYALCIFGRYPKNTGQFCASVYTVGPSNRDKGEVRELRIGPEVGKTRCETLARLLEQVEERTGEMQFKMRKMKIAEDWDGNVRGRGYGLGGPDEL